MPALGDSSICGTPYLECPTGSSNSTYLSRTHHLLQNLSFLCIPYLTDPHAHLPTYQNKKTRITRDSSLSPCSRLANLVILNSLGSLKKYGCLDPSSEILIWLVWGASWTSGFLFLIPLVMIIIIPFYWAFPIPSPPAWTYKILLIGLPKAV